MHGGQFLNDNVKKGRRKEAQNYSRCSMDPPYSIGIPPIRAFSAVNGEWIREGKTFGLWDSEPYTH